MERRQATQRAFSRELLASQERERKRIAAELHDSIGQRLIVIKNLALSGYRIKMGTLSSGNKSKRSAPKPLPLLLKYERFLMICGLIN